jgi:hypothetical protein
MNRLASTHAFGQHLVGAEAVPIGRRGPKVKRKPGFPGFSVRMMAMYRDRVKAAAEIYGYRCVSHFCYWAILNYVGRVERQVGLPAGEMVRLTKAQRAELAEKFQLVFAAAWPRGQKTKPARN